MKPTVKVSLCDGRWDVALKLEGKLFVGTGESIEEAVGDVVKQIMEEVAERKVVTQ